ncbi:MAG: FAD:protein FMN transferase [Flavobacteriaceae bacterium]|nr:FAD:protein FMN transferase [Flavobacteriaceae bacterium]
MRFIYALIVIVFISCGKDTSNPNYVSGNAFGTTYNIQYYSSSDFDVEEGLDSVFYAVNKSVSTYMPSSDISKINHGDSTIIVDAIFKEVYNISEMVYTNSKGYFDPTIGVLRNAYGFGDSKPLAQIDSLTLDSLMQYVGFQKVELLSNGSITKEHPEIYFDFNAVAKGYGIDQIGKYLEGQGVEHYLIELGGELLTKGENLAKNQNWIAGIESVDSSLEDRSISAKVSLTNVGMASSGNYRKFRIDSITGKKYVHTINPLTGKAEQSDVTSATVIAPTCALADAYATAFMAMGLERSVTLIKELDDIHAYLTYSNSSKLTETFISEGFKKYLVD